MSELWKKSAVELAELVRKRQVTAVEVTESVLDRLNTVNPKLNAVVQELPEEALSEAKKVDEKIKIGDYVGPLAGVPVTIKVNTDQVGYASTNGLQIQKDLIANEDNPVVTNFRKADAIIVGRTNTPAFSLRWFTRNSLHGETLNPHDVNITPGGSSGGASSSLAVGIGAIAHGSDIGGSIRYPAYACGLQGLRPTLGRIAAVNFTAQDRGIGPQLMAVSGPLARSIDDLSLALSVMSMQDHRDPWWTPAPIEISNHPKRVALCVNPDGLKTVPEVEKSLRESAAKLQEAGWQVEEQDIPPLREPAKHQLTLWLSEARKIGTDIFEKEGDPDASFVFQVMETVCPVPDINGLLDALQRRMPLLREWNLFFEKYPVLLCPISAELPFKNHIDVTSKENMLNCLEAQLTQVGFPFLGLPGLSVATGKVGTSPVGVQLVAGRYQESILLAAGKEIESRSPVIFPIEPNF